MAELEELKKEVKAKPIQEPQAVSEKNPDTVHKKASQRSERR